MFNNSQNLGDWNNNNSGNDNRQFWNNNNSSPVYANNNTQTHGIPDYVDRSLVPTTIKKILSQPCPSPDAPFQIDGKTIHQISIQGTIIQISIQSTHTLYTIDEYNAIIKCKLWISDNSFEQKCDDSTQLKVGDVCKVIGKVSVFEKRKSINVHHISKITNFNHMYHHGLEVILAHELNNVLINQHIPQMSQMWNTYIEQAHNEQNKAKEDWQKYKAQKQSKNALEENVLQFLQAMHANNANRVNYLGQTLDTIMLKVGCNDFNLIQTALNRLYQLGLVHDTVDGSWDATN